MDYSVNSFQPPTFSTSCADFREMRVGDVHSKRRWFSLVRRLFLWIFQRWHSSLCKSSKSITSFQIIVQIIVLGLSLLWLIILDNFNEILKFHRSVKASMDDVNLNDCLKSFRSSRKKASFPQNLNSTVW